MKQKIRIFNGKIITPYRILPKGSIIINDGKIESVYEDNDEPDDEAKEFDMVIDAKGKYISPGFIDIHVHGGGGADFMDGSVEAFTKVADTHVKFGTTGLFPTTLTSEFKELEEALSLYEDACKANTNGAEFLGIHLEGPYLSVLQKGAQDPKFLKAPDPSEYEKIINKYGNIIKRWDAAPELKGALRFGQYLRSNGIIASMAHTNAIYEEAVKGFESGYSLATHFYSCMSGVSRIDAYRYAGVIESGYILDEMNVEIIADGKHMPVPLLQMVYKIKGTSRTALITDAMRAAGMPEGESILGSLKYGQRCIVENGVALMPDRTSFAGSVATTNRLVRIMYKEVGIPLQDAVRMMSLTPAQIMKIDNYKGSISSGKDADIIIFDSDINVEMSIIKGKIVFKI